MDRRYRTAAIAFVVAACGGEPARSVPVAKTAPPAAEDPAACGKRLGYRHEPISLPPEFAPGMPAGEEELLFHPQMFEPTANGYWSYVFVFRLQAPVTGTAALTALLTDYYRGLIDAVGKAKKVEHDLAKVRVALTEVEPGAEYTGALDVIDAFASGKPLALQMQLSQRGACVRAAVSPRLADDTLRAELGRALACLPCDP